MNRSTLYASIHALSLEAGEAFRTSYNKDYCYGEEEELLELYKGLRRLLPKVVSPNGKIRHKGHLEAHKSTQP